MAECRKCGKCCKYTIFQIPSSLPKSYASYYEARGFTVLLEQRTLVLNVPCPHLVDGLCDIHDSKPKLCRDFESGNLGGSLILSDCAYAEEAKPEQILTLPEDLWEK